MKRLQRGDTIVEVLICIAIAGMILAGAFVVSNRSQLGVRDSQEHAEASKLLQSQLEQLRSNARLQGGTIFTFAAPPQGFCMDGGAKPISATDPRCVVNSSGAQYNGSNAYTIAIQRASAGSGVAGQGRVFTLTVTWASISGVSSQSSETMTYRLYP